MISVSQDRLHIRSPLLGWDWITVQAAIDKAPKGCAGLGI